MQILIYGAPGAGKTTASKLLHEKLKVELYEGDYLREVVLPNEVGESDDPFLYVGTKQAWRQFGELNAENVVKGLKSVRKSMWPYIEKVLAQYPEVIFEAAFLDPTVFQHNKLYLVVTTDELKHREQFFRGRKYFHPQYGSNELEEGFQASRLIQDYLLAEAERLTVSVIRNKSDENALAAQFSLFD
jgi:2-phosphoglycerate kinase